MAAPRRLLAGHDRHTGGERRVLGRDGGDRRMSRSGSVHRVTKETSIDLLLEIDGSGSTEISTGIPFYDHMLEQVGKHAGFDLRIAASGDLHIDTHHTVEDVLSA